MDRQVIVFITGYEIPAGTGISPEFSLVHIDPELYERPDFFCPERHLNDQGELVKVHKCSRF